MKNDPYQSLRFPEFKPFLVARFAVTFGWSMQFAIIEWEVYSLTKDPLSIGFIGLVELLPAIAMALFAGHVVDHQDKRGLFVKCLVAFSTLSLGLFLLTWPRVVADLPKDYILYGIYVLVFLGGFVRAFFGPTIFSLMALLVPKKIYANATSWNSMFQQMGAVLGPAVGGLLIHWIGVHWSLCLVFFLALLSLTQVLRIAPKPVKDTVIREPVFRSLGNGLRFVFKTRVILAAMTLDLIAVLFGGAITLAPIFAQDILHVGAQGYGFLRAAPAVGSFLTMVLSTRFPLDKRAGIKLLVAIFGFGVAIIIFGLSTWYWLSLLALFFSGAADGISLIIRQTILQIKTPDEMRGRVASVNSIFTGSSNEFGSFESGLMARLLGTSAAVVFGGSMTLITVISTAIGFPKLRSLDLREEI